MLMLNDPSEAAAITDPDLRSLIEQRFEDICDGEEFDPDLHGFMIVVEPGDSVEVLEEESGCPILSAYTGNVRYGDPGFKPVFECLEEHPSFYDLAYVPGGVVGVVIFIPKAEGIDSDLLAMCAEYAEPAP